MKLVSPVQQTTDMAKKLIKKRKTSKRKPVKRNGQKKRSQGKKSVQRNRKVQKQKSIKGGKKGRVVGSFVRRKDILSVDVYKSNLHLFEKAPVDKATEKTEWIPFSPVSQMAKNAPLEFDIPGNAAAYLDLSKSRLKVGVEITKADGKSIAVGEKVC